MQDHGLSSRVRIEFAQASDPGRDPNKQVNEDSCGYAETRHGHLIVLCDGMGGHYGGKEASRTAITTIFEIFESLPPGTLPAAALKSSIEEAGRRVYKLGGPPENRVRPGSTVVAMLIHDRGLDVAHVGDSRAYVIRSSQIYPLTRDHSMVQGMIDAGMLTEEQAIGHPDSNKITRALGMKPEVDVEVRPETMELFPGDVLLQSSDGLTDLALGADILAHTRQAFSSGDVAFVCNSLVKLANDRGGHDNITVQMARIAEVAPKTTMPGGPSHAAPPQQTVNMTAPPGLALAHAASTGTPGYGPASGHAQGWSPQSSRPVPITAPDAAAHGGGVGPTMTDASMSAGAAAGGIASTGGAGWGSGGFGAHAASTGTPAAALPPVQSKPQTLQGFRMESGPGSLPLPPASTRASMPSAPTFGAPPGGMAPGAPTPSAPPVGFGTPAAGPVDAGRAVSFGPPPMVQAPPAMGYGPQNQARGGIVFVIIGMSAVIAILIVIVLWLALK